MRLFIAALLVTGLLVFGCVQQEGEKTALTAAQPSVAADATQYADLAAEADSAADVTVAETDALASATDAAEADDIDPSYLEALG